MLFLLLSTALYHFLSFPLFLAIGGSRHGAVAEELQRFDIPGGHPRLQPRQQNTDCSALNPCEEGCCSSFGS